MSVRGGRKRVALLYRLSTWLYRQWWLWFAASAFLCVAWLSGPAPSQDALVLGPLLTVTSSVGLWLLRRRRTGR